MIFKQVVENEKSTRVFKWKIKSEKNKSEKPNALKSRQYLKKQLNR